jgi:hypothetical protein
MRLLAIASIALALLAAGALPAAAHVRVFVGGSLPLYAYPYPVYSYPAYSYPPPIPGFEYETIPPPSWAPGRWEWQRDTFGRRYRVWVPPHLR